ncbi:50S ribosomal protein L28 [Nitzschia inconspicua]|uniref:50S ribosomal protein L28 n=1 Tax=Nitzschia inconspicua TaxID=303405 RepID=A0A9K3LEI0_9STRA|nr:50S ribosomal protein L28 [Nitzschia inconspicua]
MNKFLSFIVAVLAIAEVAAFMGTPVCTQRPASMQRNGASSMEMRARVCDLLGKTPNRQARVVTFSHKRIKKVQHVNLQWKRFFSESLNRNVRLRLSTKGIKTVNKMGGIDAAAKKFDVDLAKF